MLFKYSQDVVFVHASPHKHSSQSMTYSTSDVKLPGLPPFILEILGNEHIMRWSHVIESVDFDGGTFQLFAKSRPNEVVTLRLRGSSFPPAASGSLTFTGSFPYRGGTYTLHFIRSSNVTRDRQAESFFASTQHQVPNDVCFTFPRTGRTLWSNETILRKASPYLAALLDSGFSESISASATPPTRQAETAMDPYDFDESDEESDTLQAPQEKQKETELAKFKRIDIKQAPYTTYANVLCWIGSGYIQFAKIRSTQQVDLSLIFGKRRPESAKPPSLLPRPASPKSVYRLAHLLELRELSAIALANFKSQLNVYNAAHELNSDTAGSYPEIRDIVIEYVVEHWKEVIKSAAWRQMAAQAQTVGVDGLTGFLLSQKLTEKYAK
ncbi:hypothetical protein JCM3766R1_007072 [Sporobolomyces carnicolor]